MFTRPTAFTPRTRNPVPWWHIVTRTGVDLWTACAPWADYLTDTRLGVILEYRLAVEAP